MSKHPDPWLVRWLSLLRAHAAGGPVLEIGCGDGDDTAVLARAGLDVVAIERDPEGAAAAQRKVPAARVFCQDMREPFPPVASPCGAVVASLSLHYFGWDQTVGLVERIRALLVTGAPLLCRLNASDDHHFGASGHPEIEPGLFLVDGQPKRFFDRAQVLALFANGWHVRSLEHHVTYKYADPKALWEAVLERTD